MADFEEQRTLQQPNKWLRPLGFASVAFGVALGILMALAHTKAYGIGSPFIALGGLAAIFGGMGNVLPVRRSAKISADAKGIRADGVLLAERAGIDRAYVQPRAGHSPLVRFRGKRGTRNFDVVVNDEADGTKLLGALELDVAHRAVDFRGSSPLYATIGRQMLVGAGAAVALLASPMVSRTLGGGFAAITFMLPFVMIAMALLPSTLTVGADGVLTSWLGWKHFYPYEEIVSVLPYEHGITLALKSGKTVNIATSPARRTTIPLVAMNRDAVAMRIDEAMTAFAQHRGADATAMVARGGRTVTEWLEALRALASASDYRQSALPREALWRVAEDPAAEATARAGAAVALRGTITDEDRARLRVAAEASASPRVRVALEAAASAQDDKDVEAALEELKEDA